MKVLLYGATGMIGGAIATELRARGHHVTPATRRGSGADVTSARSVAGLAPGHDAVVSAVRPAPGEGPSRVVDAARTLIDTLPNAGVHRLVIVSGAGGLLGPDGIRAADDPSFDPAYRPFSLAHVDALSLYRRADPVLNWTMVCCARVIEPGQRTGHYRIGGDRMLTDADGVSRITTADYAVALTDELETTAHPRARMSVAY